MGFFNPVQGVKLLEIEQRTDVWHSWRNGDDLPDKKPRVTGTMAAIIAGDSIRGITPYQLWAELTGRKKAPELSDFLKKLFAHGEKLEPKARRAYEELTGNRVKDVCVQHPSHPWAGSSLDGLTPSADIIAEFKCPISQRIHNLAKANLVPSYYVPQCHWQLQTTPTARELHYMSYFEEDEDGQTEALVIVKRDDGYGQWLFNEALAFRTCLIEDRPPTTQDWVMAARIYRSAKGDKEEIDARLEQAQSSLMSLMPEDKDSYEGGGLRLTRYTGKLDVDPLEILRKAGISDKDAKDALEKSRSPGPVDLEKACQMLELDEAKVREAEAELKKLKEAEARKSGKMKSRITLTSDYDEKVERGAEPSQPGQREQPKESSLAQEAEQGQWTW